MTPATKITVEAIINAPVSKVWEYWSTPAHIKQWAFASDDWHVPFAENDLRIDGKFKTRMEAKDGSFAFDFKGVYTNVETYKLIEYKLEDEREVKIEFIDNGNQTHVVETFDPDEENPRDMQQGGWQLILNNLKKYAEG